MTFIFLVRAEKKTLWKIRHSSHLNTCSSWKCFTQSALKEITRSDPIKKDLGPASLSLNPSWSIQCSPHQILGPNDKLFGRENADRHTHADGEGEKVLKGTLPSITSEYCRGNSIGRAVILGRIKYYSKGRNWPRFVFTYLLDHKRKR